VIRTAVGYAGGTSSNPTYHDLGDHSETVRIEFDPRQVSYQELLTVFWESHDPTYQVWSRQYRNAVFTLTESQREQAEASRNRLAARYREKIVTAIEPAGTFYLAEDYHQKYLLRQADSIFHDLQAAYPEAKELTASTAAARLNGYLGCSGDPDVLQREIGELGLSPAMQQRLIEYVSTECEHFSGASCPTPRR